MTGILDQIDDVLAERKLASNDSDDSYVARLYAEGLDAILKKIGEEATETVLAAKDGNGNEIIHEVADLWFHCMVMLSQQGLSSRNVLNELTRRFGVSGLTEKASRTP